jgi:hypothetical protein
MQLKDCAGTMKTLLFGSSNSKKIQVEIESSQKRKLPDC